jgi:hypothetical protein
LAFGCGAEPTDRTPEGAVRRFLDAMSRTGWDSAAREQAYRLLAPETREELRARAKRTSSLTGRSFEPWDMLARGRFRLRFTPREQGGLRAEVEGDRATVEVRGAKPTQRAEVQLVREEGAWRVALGLPDM